MASCGRVGLCWHDLWVWWVVRLEVVGLVATPVSQLSAVDHSCTGTVARSVGVGLMVRGGADGLDRSVGGWRAFCVLRPRAGLDPALMRTPRYLVD